MIMMDDPFKEKILREKIDIKYTSSFLGQMFIKLFCLM